MKKNMYEFPKSSFLGMGKDTYLIVEKILGNSKLLKLIYYTGPDCSSQPDLTREQKQSLFTNGQISNIPRIKVDKENYNYLRITYDDFTPNMENPYYRDHILELKIICHFDNWDLKDFELRPYRIAGELDSMLNGAHLTGIGDLTFVSASQNIYDDEFGGITLRYLAVRGNEDKVNP